MKNALKYVFGLLDLAKNLGNWTIFSEKVIFSKNAHLMVYKLQSNPCISTRECPKVLKICQITKFDISFQKKT
jgi:hypothetical protein